MKIYRGARGEIVAWAGTGFPLGVYHSTFVSRSNLGLAWAFARPSFPPSDWLQRRQMIRALSAVSGPPFECGMMWSTSALLGLPEYSQSSCVLQLGSGQWVMCASRCLTSFVTRFHLAVPVLDAAIVHHLVWLFLPRAISRHDRDLASLAGLVREVGSLIATRVSCPVLTRAAVSRSSSRLATPVRKGLLRHAYPCHCV